MCTTIHNHMLDGLLQKNQRAWVSVAALVQYVAGGKTHKVPHKLERLCD